MKVGIHFFFKKWRQAVEFRKYDEWCENKREEQEEEEFACENGMDSELWCWNCKHDSCDIHNSLLDVEYDSDDSDLCEIVENLASIPQISSAKSFMDSLKQREILYKTKGI